MPINPDKFGFDSEQLRQSMTRNSELTGFYEGMGVLEYITLLESKLKKHHEAEESDYIQNEQIFRNLYKIGLERFLKSEIEKANRARKADPLCVLKFIINEQGQIISSWIVSTKTVYNQSS